MRTNYPGFQVSGPRDGREAARVVNNILSGHLNVVLEIDVPADATSVDVTDARLVPSAVPLAAVGSTITAIQLGADPGTATVTLTAGPARTERLVLLG